MRVCAVNFWPAFDFGTGLIRHLLDRALGTVTPVGDESDADLVVSSVFMRRPPRFRDKTILFCFENHRPDYRHYRYSVSSDFDTYGGRNCRLAVWQSYLRWPGMIEERPTPGQLNHGYEPAIEIAPLLQPRPDLVASSRPRFCCFVAGNPETHRLHAAEGLNRIDAVDLFGGIANRPLRRSKLEALRDYRFNLCFENSIYPGYYTEKILHAWVSGCVPLYYADPWCVREFNPKAFVNRLDFASLDDFVKHVAKIAASPTAIDDIVREPLLRETPTLEPVVEFLRKACADIVA